MRLRMPLRFPRKTRMPAENADGRPRRDVTLATEMPDQRWRQAPREVQRPRGRFGFWTIYGRTYLFIYWSLSAGCVAMLLRRCHDPFYLVLAEAPHFPGHVRRDA